MSSVGNGSGGAGGGSGSSTPRGGMTPPPIAGQQQPAAAAQPSDSPNPLTVGMHFVKQYYKVLSTSPNQLHRFYQSASVLSVGVGSQPTQPTSFGDLQQSSSFHELKQRFCDDFNTPIRFDLEHGAIDAQVSVEGGVLLSVTGHVAYLEQSKDGAPLEVPETSRRRAFVHTFFLGAHQQGTKRSYYVRNDILRFLHEDQVEEGTVVVSNRSMEASAPISTADAATESQAAPSTTPAEVTVASTEPMLADEPEAAKAEPPAPGGGVEESKEALLEDDDEEEEAEPVEEAAPEPEEIVEPPASKREVAPPPAAEEQAVPPANEVEPKVEEEPAPAPAPSNSEPAPKAADDTKKEAAVAPAPQPAPAPAAPSKPAAPGSWASLVAKSAPTSSAPASATTTPTQTPVRPSKAAPAAAARPSPAEPAAPSAATDGATSTAAPAAATAAASTPTTPSAGSNRPAAQQQQSTQPQHSQYQPGGHYNKYNKRDPDSTLVIRNIDSATKQSEVLELFEPFATAHNSKIVGTTVSTHKAIAFVDYESPAPVLAAVEQHQNEPFSIRGRPLDVYQKTLENRSSKKYMQSGGYRGGGQRGDSYRGGGRQGYRRGGRVDRGGGRGGRGGR